MKNILSKNRIRIFQWGAFALFFAFFWRTYNIFTHLPDYGDALEVVWGIQWYNHALTEWTSPFYYPYIFHPEGWQVGILAHTPLLFLFAQPFYLLGGEVFSFNMLAIIPFFISYIGALRFFKHYSKSTLTVVLVSLAFTFTTMRSSRATSHLNVLWATSFFPWLADHLLSWYKEEIDSVKHKHILLSGVYFGLMISFSLYSIFLAPVIFLFLGNRLFRWQTIKQLSVVVFIAAVIGSTAILPYYLATRHELITPPTFQQLAFFSGSINNLFIPSVFHPVPQVKQIADYFQVSWGGEARSLNMGLVTLVLVIIGVASGFRSKQKNNGNRWVLIFALILALGPILKLNGRTIEFGSLQWLNTQLWQLGHWLKPSVFIAEAIPEAYLNSIPLPGYLFIVLIPFWEGARASVRFAFVAFLGALSFAATGLDWLPKWVRWALMLVWLVEFLPASTGSYQLDFEEVHPAHAWLGEQLLQPEEGVLDFQTQIVHGPAPLYASWQTKIPTAAAIGSFRPAQNQFLFDQTFDLTNREPDLLSKILSAYKIRYVVIHNNEGSGTAAWEYFQANPEYFSSVDCFIPPADYVSPWAYPICIVEVKTHTTVSNIFPVYGFSPVEAWGVWSIEDRPRFNFIATAKKPYLLSSEVFPHCIDDKKQSLKLVFQEEVLQELAWENCDPISFETTLPAENIQVGFNELHFEFQYALSGVELGTNNDPRKLSVGFSRLEVRPLD